MNQTVDGCSSVQLEYENPNFSETDSVTLAISNPNLLTSNDTAHTYLQNVDTVSGRLRLEVQNPTGWNSGAYLNSNSGSYTYVNVDATNNYTGDIFLSPGCHSVNGGLYTEDTASCAVLISSIDAFGNTQDTLFYESLEQENPTYFDGVVYVTDAVDPVLSGYVFEDPDITQTFNPEMTRIEGIEVSHGPYTTFTDANGFYEIPAATIADPVSITYDENVWQVITTDNPLYMTSESPSPYNFGLDQDEPFDSLTLLYDSNIPYFCESELMQYITVENTGNQTTGGEVIFTYDPLLTPVDYYPDPDQIDGTTLTYTIPEVSLNGFYQIYIRFDTLSADDIGEVLNSEVTLNYNDVSGTQIATDTVSTMDSLYCAFDPNDIYGFPLGTGAEGFIAANSPLKYRIRFQNTGNYPTTHVVVTDTLPEELDWSSFQSIGSSHPYTLQLDENTREIKWTFANINLPDSSSDPIGSNGNIWYSVAMNDLDQGDQIVYQAAIHFDSNAPVITNTSLHTIQGVTAVAEIDGNLPFSLYPNPADDKLILNFEEAIKGRVEIYDLQGRKCLESTLNTRTLTLSIGALESGMYLISVSNSANQTRSTARFVKM